MPLFIDIHDVPGVTPQDVANAHLADIKVQDRYGVDYRRYWLNQKQGKIYCLCEAPSAEAADAVHREAHGLTAVQILEVTEALAEAFMGTTAEVDSGGAALIPESGERDPGTRTILFTDIVGSTAATQALGDDGAFELLDVHDRIVRAALENARGREVKHTGDGIMAAFLSAAGAIRCGMEIQESLVRHNVERPDLALAVRIGVASGEPIERHNDLFGATVQLAARLCACAEPCQIVASNAVAELCVGKKFPFRDGGHVPLKGFDQPAHVHVIEVTAAPA